MIDEDVARRCGTMQFEDVGDEARLSKEKWGRGRNRFVPPGDVMHVHGGCWGGREAAQIIT